MAKTARQEETDRMQAVILACPEGNCPYIRSDGTCGFEDAKRRIESHKERATEALR